MKRKRVVVVMKDQIENLRKEMTVKEIAAKLNCAESTIRRRLDPEKDRTARAKSKTPAKTSIQTKQQRARRLKAHPYDAKIDKFMRETGKTVYGVLKKNWSLDDVVKTFGENPVCYITGDVIDIKDSGSYCFDHIVSRFNKGSNELDNLGICTTDANYSKSRMTYDPQYIMFCLKVIKHYYFTKDKPTKFSWLKKLVFTWLFSSKSKA